MSEKISVTDSEWRIMHLLWQHGNLTMARITGALQQETGWSKHTVISLLKRMCQKGSAAVIEGTSPMQYRALITREEAIKQETHSVVQKIFGGNSLLLINSLVSQNDLSDDEIDELVELLEKQRRSGGEDT